LFNEIATTAGNRSPSPKDKKGVRCTAAFFSITSGIHRRHSVYRRLVHATSSRQLVDVRVCAGRNSADLRVAGKTHRASGVVLTRS